MSVEIVHWNPSKPVVRGPVGRLIPFRRPVNNFGDVLGPLVVERVLKSKGYTYPTGGEARRLLAIGSILHLALPGDTVWGSGINGKRLDRELTRQIDVRAVRGPRTRSMLLQRGIETPEVYGDPGLLTSRLFPEHGTEATRRAGVLVVPNLFDYPAIKQSWREFAGSDMTLLDPRSPLDQCLTAIAAADLVVGSSLHGIIVAESYGVPARLVRSDVEPDFKYLDYFEGSGREGTASVGSVAAAVSAGGGPAPEWNAQPLLDAFPVDLFTRLE